VAAGEITGVVRDQEGAAVPGAVITVTEVRTSLRRVVVSTADGVYTAASLAPGEYRVEVELSGFKPVRRLGIRIATGEKARLDFDLDLGAVHEQVTVVADAPIAREATASLGTVVENEQVARLPLNGRLFITLATIAPGVALPPNSVASPCCSRNPARSRSTQSSMPFRSSRSRATVRRRSSGDSMEGS
jgi:hypothetical protein